MVRISQKNTYSSVDRTTKEIAKFCSFHDLPLPKKIQDYLIKQVQNVFDNNPNFFNEDVVLLKSPGVNSYVDNLVLEENSTQLQQYKFSLTI